MKEATPEGLHNLLLQSLSSFQDTTAGQSSGAVFVVLSYWRILCSFTSFIKSNSSCHGASTVIQSLITCTSHSHKPLVLISQASSHATYGDRDIFPHNPSTMRPYLESQLLYPRRRTSWYTRRVDLKSFRLGAIQGIKKSPRGGNNEAETGRGRQMLCNMTCSFVHDIGRHWNYPATIFRPKGGYLIDLDLVYSCTASPPIGAFH